MIKASIVIPTYNDKFHLSKTLQSIFSQIDEFVEIIIVDNGSTDGTLEMLRSQDNITVIEETENLNSPYSCRNRGIEASTGECIILLDATCIPDADWLKNGLNYMRSHQSDIIGGNVLFDFEGQMTPSKILDSLTNIKMKESIEQRKVAKTANLFINRQVFDKIGMFPEKVRSGADVRWTHRVTESGVEILFCPSAIVYKPARGFKELLKKQWRVGLYQPLIWRDLNRTVSVIDCLKKFVIPVSPLSIKKLLNEKGTRTMQRYFLRIWFVAQLIKMLSAVANLRGMRMLRKEKYH